MIQLRRKCYEIDQKIINHPFITIINEYIKEYSNSTYEKYSNIEFRYLDNQPYVIPKAA